MEGVAGNGGYIMDASAIIQNDAKIENVRAMTEATLEFGVYPRGHASARSNSEGTNGEEPSSEGPRPLAEDRIPGQFLAKPSAVRLQPGECYRWQQKREEIEEISGDEQLCRRIWQEVDALGNSFIWQLLLSF
jgi:hypothetical protein